MYVRTHQFHYFAKVSGAGPTIQHRKKIKISRYHILLFKKEVASPDALLHFFSNCTFVNTSFLQIINPAGGGDETGDFNARTGAGGGGRRGCMV